MLFGGILWGGGQPAGLAAAKTSLSIQKVLIANGIKGNGRPPNPPQHLVWPFISIFLLAGAALCRKNP
jgi:hypothetical protein